VDDWSIKRPAGQPPHCRDLRGRLYRADRPTGHGTRSEGPLIDSHRQAAGWQSISCRRRETSCQTNL